MQSCKNLTLKRPSAGLLSHISKVVIVLQINLTVCLFTGKSDSIFSSLAPQAKASDMEQSPNSPSPGEQGEEVLPEEKPVREAEHTEPSTEKSAELASPQVNGKPPKTEHTADQPATHGDIHDSKKVTIGSDEVDQKTEIEEKSVKEDAKTATAKGSGLIWFGAATVILLVIIFFML